jgi:site-specific DNA-methyltransferase (adenine-specific)
VLLRGNCLEQLKVLADNSIDCVVSDPPYELGFMGKSWDASGIAYSQDLWAECLRVLKPGGHLLAFGGSRTYHRLASAVEDAGFEIRDQIMWLYGSGFPKSHNLKDEREGWGTALKPAHEPIVVARKPLIGTVANNVLTYGTGALNIEGSRVGTTDQPRIGNPEPSDAAQTAFGEGWQKSGTTPPEGRWPANVIHDGSDEVLAGFPESKSGKAGIRTSDGFNNGVYGNGMGIKAGQSNGEYGDSDSAARFFYCAKASKSERNAGTDGANNHPTVKPLALMRYLIKLVTPPNGVVLDPFLGSGTTAVAAVLEGFEWVGCELTEDYWPIIEARVAWAEKERATQTPEATQPTLFGEQL